MSMKARISSFFARNRYYAVLGASNNPSKFGFKILNWYIQHDLPVVPINPKEKEILAQEVIADLNKVIEAIKEKKDIGSHRLSTSDSLSISFLTPPPVTKKALEKLSKVENYKDIIKGMWVQPGSYDAAVLDTAEKIGLIDRLVFQDECILIRGEEGLYNARL